VAFMLVHFFCLLEFKFRFESFSKNPKYLILKPYSYLFYPFPYPAHQATQPNPAPSSRSAAAQLRTRGPAPRRPSWLSSRRPAR
jgi:hypothetical protein